uniref:uncharacterized protein LOC120337311 n=1 Tax=Styela clava TaxID=7725 RepID=UPI00193967C3|nr:uncharacterized protein LOC120337311 [Styela clava]
MDKKVYYTKTQTSDNYPPRVLHICRSVESSIGGNLTTSTIGTSSALMGDRSPSPNVCTVPHDRNNNVIVSPSWASKQNPSIKQNDLQVKLPTTVNIKTEPECDSPNIVQMTVPCSSKMRRVRRFVPTARKDEFYWMKRRKNNEAARRSREKRRTNDLVLAQKVLLLLKENFQLKRELLAVKLKYNEIDPSEVEEIDKYLRKHELHADIQDGLNLMNFDLQEIHVQPSSQFHLAKSGETKLPSTNGIASSSRLTENVNGQTMHNTLIQNGIHEKVSSINEEIKSHVDGKHQVLNHTVFMEVSCNAESNNTDCQCPEPLQNSVPDNVQKTLSDSNRAFDLQAPSAVKNIFVQSYQVRNPVNSQQNGNFHDNDMHKEGKTYHVKYIPNLKAEQQRSSIQEEPNEKLISLHTRSYSGTDLTNISSDYTSTSYEASCDTSPKSAIDRHDAPDKNLKLPYKLRFKLGTMQSV